MRFTDFEEYCLMGKAPNISRPALEVRAAFSFTRSSSRPHFHCVTASAQPKKVVHRRDRRGSARTP